MSDTEKAGDGFNWRSAVAAAYEAGRLSALEEAEKAVGAQAVEDDEPPVNYGYNYGVRRSLRAVRALRSSSPEGSN